MFCQKKQIETTQNEYKDLQAKYEKETSEMITKHDADIKGFKQNLLDAEEALKIAQKKNNELETQAEELKKQAEEARVCILFYSASLQLSVSVFFCLASPFHRKIFTVFVSFLIFSMWIALD